MESEVCPLKWDAIDFTRGTATLMESKTRKTVRPLGAAALALLEELPRLDGSPYVFPSVHRNLVTNERILTKPMRAPRRLWEAVRDHAGLQGVRVHDLRHSYGSTAADAGESLIVIASLLGHKRTSTSERYAKARRDARQTAADKVSGELARLLG